MCLSKHDLRKLATTRKHTSLNTTERSARCSCATSRAHAKMSSCEGANLTHSARNSVRYAAANAFATLSWSAAACTAPATRSFATNGLRVRDSLNNICFENSNVLVLCTFLRLARAVAPAGSHQKHGVHQHVLFDLSKDVMDEPSLLGRFDAGLQRV